MKRFLLWQTNIRHRSLDSKSKSGVISTPLLDYLKRIREERKQEKMIRNQQRRIHKQTSRNAASNMNEEDYSSSARYSTGK